MENRLTALFEGWIMEKTRPASLEFLREFQSRDEFFEKLTGEHDMTGRVANQAVLLIIFSSI